jgi:hypothetical protein
MSNGVFIVDKDFGRGIDFKFMKEASVLILLNDDVSISWEDAVQMAGRGNRSQGNPTALLMLTKPSSKNAEILTILKTNSARYGIEGSYVLLQIFDHFTSLKNENMKKRIAEYLEKYSWTVPLVETEDHRVFQWLCGMQNN